MNAPLLGTFCGTDLPPAMASSGEQVWLQFMSDFSVASNGFRLEYMTNGRTLLIHFYAFNSKMYTLANSKESVDTVC